MVSNKVYLCVKIISFMPVKPLVSVIITTKNEQNSIERLLDSLRKQSLKEFEIIVVDNNSTDNTKLIANRYTKKIYNFGPERSAQRNFGAGKSKGGYLIFIDADMTLSKNVFKECVTVCRENTQIAGVVIPERSIGRNFWENVKAFERSFYNEEGDQVTDAARFFTKEAFEKVGGYDENITGPEDWDLPENVRKAGFKIGRIESFIKHHENIKSPFTLARKKFYYALKSYRYLSKQKIPAFNPKTIYFLRPVFYKRIDKILMHPLLSAGMLIMLSLELIAGGLGYLIGRMKRL